VSTRRSATAHSSPLVTVARRPGWCRSVVEIVVGVEMGVDGAAHDFGQGQLTSSRALVEAGSLFGAEVDLCRLRLIQDGRRSSLVEQMRSRPTWYHDAVDVCPALRLLWGGEEMTAAARSVDTLVKAYADWMRGRDGVADLGAVRRVLRHKADHPDGRLTRWTTGDLAETVQELTVRRFDVDPIISCERSRLEYSRQRVARAVRCRSFSRHWTRSSKPLHSGRTRTARASSGI
jgi:hypothetical protein